MKLSISFFLALFAVAVHADSLKITRILDGDTIAGIGTLICLMA